VTLKEEQLTAIQNLGAGAFISGGILCCMAGNGITLAICFAIACIGVADVYICEYLLDKQAQKNKGW